MHARKAQINKMTLECSMSTIHDQIPASHKTGSFGQEEDDRSSEFVWCRKSAQHASTQPLLIEVWPFRQQLVRHGRPDVARGKSLNVRGEQQGSGEVSR